MGRWRQASKVRDRRVIDDFRLAQPGLCLVRSTALFSISFETVYMLLWAGHHQLGRRQNHVDHATLGTMSDIRIVIPQVRPSSITVSLLDRLLLGSSDGLHFFSLI